MTHSAFLHGYNTAFSIVAMLTTICVIFTGALLLVVMLEKLVKITKSCFRDVTGKEAFVLWIIFITCALVLLFVVMLVIGLCIGAYAP